MKDILIILIHLITIIILGLAFVFAPYQFKIISIIRYFGIYKLLKLKHESETSHFYTIYLFLIVGVVMFLIFL
jgi:hypothetical protein